MKMLSEMFGLGLSDELLAEYASRLGSDCAFFIYNRPMFGEGRGEVLSGCELGVKIAEPGEETDGEAYELQIVVPEEIHVSTAEAYKGIVPAIPQMSIRDVLKRPVGEWKELLVNDFEKTVFDKHPELSKIKASLYESGAAYASMSGSGSALFALYRKDGI